MAVLHYTKDMCGTKAKIIKSTDDKVLVTCKRCLKKMKSSTAGKVRVEKTDNSVTLSYKSLQLKFKRREHNDMFMFCSPDGFVFTSVALSGTQIKRNMVEKDRKYFKDLLISLKDEDGELTGENIYNHFKD
jgi:predicted nucleic acid-binding Zn ribbon protein